MVANGSFEEIGRTNKIKQVTTIGQVTFKTKKKKVSPEP